MRLRSQMSPGALPGDVRRLLAGGSEAVGTAKYASANAQDHSRQSHMLAYNRHHREPLLWYSTLRREGWSWKKFCEKSWAKSGV